MLGVIANEVGGEAAQAARRFIKLRRNPRPLTDAARSQLHANLAPVLNYAFVTAKVGPLPAVRQMGTVPVLHRLKQAGTRVRDGRLSAT
jgi:hypothetical protein